MNEFEKFARLHCGINSMTIHDYRAEIRNYVSPTIIEERQLNVAAMDVFSRLMMDRIIFLGAPIYDDAANIIQAQLLFLESVKLEKGETLSKVEEALLGLTWSTEDIDSLKDGKTVTHKLDEDDYYTIKISVDEETKSYQVVLF